MRNQLIGGLLTCAAVAALYHHSALAQEARAPAASNGGTLEEIVVTAQKRSENQQVVPVSVTALSPTVLANARILNAMDLAGTVPNLYIMQGASMNGSTSTPWMTLRGIEANNTGTVQTDSGIGIYVDGVYVARASGQVFDLADIEQIEVLRGPQGTLFGRDSVGGAINFITRDPSGTFGVSEDLSFGNLGEIRNKTRVDFDDFAGFRLSLTYLHSQDDGYIKNLDAGHYVDPSKLTFGAVGPGRSQRDLGAHDADGFMASVKYEPPGIEDLTIKAKFDYTGEYETPPAIQLIAVGAPAAFYYPPPYGFGAVPPPPAGPIRSRGTIVVSDQPQDAVSNSQAIQVYLQTYGASLTTTYDLFDNIQLKDIVAYRRLQQSFSSQLDGGNALVDARGNDFLPFTSIGQVNQHQLSNEMDVTFKSTWVDVTAGQLYFYEQYHYPDGYPVLASAPRGVLPAVGIISDGNAVSTAEFAQANFHLLDNLDLVAGIRYTRDDKESRYPAANQRPPNPKLDAENIHQRVDWLGGLNYRPTDNILVYGKGSSGYISGGTYNGVQFGPESMTQFELGEKADLMGKQLRVNTAIFWSDYRHYQTFDFNPNDCNGFKIGCIANAGAERIWGAESEITYVPTDRLILSANFGYTRYSLDPNQNPSAIPENHAPKLQFGVSGDYNFEEISGMTPSARLEVNYYGLIDWGPTAAGTSIPGLHILDSYKTPEQVIVNARVSLGDIPMGPAIGKVSLWGKNLTDTRYFSEVLPGSVIGFVDGNVSPPATYGVDLSFKWEPASPPAETPVAFTPPPAQAPMAPHSYLVFFDFNKSDLTSQAQQIVDQAASNAGPAKVTRLTVTGHTDTVGSDAYNMRLSRRRAESVAARLEKDGIPSGEIEIVAKGKRDLLVPTADGVKEPQNRRVQIVYEGGATS
jgi:iron complex outermembrane receptor protein